MRDGPSCCVSCEGLSWPARDDARTGTRTTGWRSGDRLPRPSRRRYGNRTIDHLLRKMVGHRAETERSCGRGTTPLPSKPYSLLFQGTSHRSKVLPTVLKYGFSWNRVGKTRASRAGTLTSEVPERPVGLSIANYLPQGTRRAQSGPLGCSLQTIYRRVRGGRRGRIGVRHHQKYRVSARCSAITATRSPPRVPCVPCVLCGKTSVFRLFGISGG